MAMCSFPFPSCCLSLSPCVFVADELPVLWCHSLLRWSTEKLASKLDTVKADKSGLDKKRREVR